MKQFMVGLAALLLLFGGAGQAKADLVYDNGPINGTVQAWLINLGDSVSDSFTVASPTTLTSAQVGLWVFPGDTPATVSWSIGTSKFGSDVNSGTSSTTNVFQFTNHTIIGNSDVYELTFSLSATLAAGTYWLTLSNATSSNSFVVGWDQNSGPSMAANNFSPSIPSESFQLYNSLAPVPEPATAAPFCLGALGLLGYGWRRRS